MTAAVAGSILSSAANCRENGALIRKYNPANAPEWLAVSGISFYKRRLIGTPSCIEFPREKKLEDETGMNKKIKFRVNGKRIETEVPTNRLLIDCLRYDLGLTGTKEGCSVGVCGACTVLMDGKPVLSCALAPAKAEGKAITTLEGLDEDGNPRKIAG